MADSNNPGSFGLNLQPYAPGGEIVPEEVFNFTRLSELAVNVKAYGARGDNSTDDTAAIQAAIDAAGVGGIVYFPVGIYKCLTGLTVTNAAVRFLGEGWDQTGGTTIGSIIQAGAAMTDLVNVTGPSFQCQGMSFDGVARPTNILTLNALNCQVTGSHLRRPANNGAHINIGSSGTSAWLRDLRINGANQAGTVGILVGGTDGIIDGCKVVNVKYGIQASASSSGLQIIGGHTTPGSTIGVNNIYLSGNGSNIVMSGHRFDNTGLGSPLQIDPSSNIQNIVVNGCVFFQSALTDATFAAIGVDTTTNIVKGMSITGCTALGSAAAANRFKYFLAAQIQAGSAATNTTRLSTGGTAVAGCTAQGATAFYSANPLSSRGCINTTDLTTFAVVTDI